MNENSKAVVFALLLATTVGGVASAPEWSRILYSLPSDRGFVSGQNEQGRTNNKHNDTQNASSFQDNRPTTNQEQQGSQYLAIKPDWIQAFWATISGIATVAILYATRSQAQSSARQAELMVRQTEIGRVAADAALIAADAAAKSIARPWLVVESIDNNVEFWVSGSEILIGHFRIANYGDAPALIESIKVAYILCEGRGSLPPEIKDVLKDAIVQFPAPADFGWFVEKHGRPPKKREEAVPGNPNFGYRFTDISKNEGRFNLAIPKGGCTELLHSFNRTKVVYREDTIAVETVLRHVILGSIFYTMPDEKLETLSFCFYSDSGAGFNMFMDSPYNERKNINRH